MLLKLLVVALAIGAASAGPLDVDRETESFLRDSASTESYAEALEFVQASQKETNGTDKCNSMVKATEDGVKANIASEQTRVNNMNNGSACDAVGKNQVSDAKDAMTAASLNLKKAQQNLTAALSTKITWTYDFSAVDENHPSKFFQASQYLAVKALVKKLKKAVLIAEGLVTQANLTHAAAIKTVKKKKLKCQCDAYTTMQKEVKTVKAAINASNTKAWTKAAHLSCVLAGISMSDCKVKAMPTISAPELAPGVGKSACMLGGIKVEGINGLIYVPTTCAKKDWKCQGKAVCDFITKETCKWQSYTCSGGGGSWYPPSGGGSSNFNFAIAYDFTSNNYGNICACKQGLMGKWGLKKVGTFCGVGRWHRDSQFPSR